MTHLINLQGQPWTPGPLHPIVGFDEVHVWRVNLDLDAPAVNQCRYVLSDDEVARAEAFRFDEDRDRWIVSRGLLRVVLGRYLYREPRDIQFRAAVNQKPSLVLMESDIDLRFNISHSEGVALFAVSLCREVGIDIERIRRNFSAESVAGQVLSSAELFELSATADCDRQSAFFSLWTCKEAYVKALGAGLSYPMTRFTVSLSPDSNGVAVLDVPVTGHGEAVTVQRLTVGPEHCAAVALQGRISRLRCWHGPAGVPIGLWRLNPTNGYRAA